MDEAQFLKWARCAKCLATGMTISLGLIANAQTSGSSTFPQATGVPATRSEMKPHIGVLAGIAQPEGSYNAAAELGLDVGYQPSVPFGLGAELSHFESDASEGNEDLERTAILVKGTYHLAGTTPVIRDSYVGVGVGPVFTSDETAVQAAPLLGFDIPIERGSGRFFSVGANAKYAFISGSASDALSVNGAVKYWY